MFSWLIYPVSQRCLLGLGYMGDVWRKHRSTLCGEQNPWTGKAHKLCTMVCAGFWTNLAHNEAIERLSMINAKTSFSTSSKVVALAITMLLTVVLAGCGSQSSSTTSTPVEAQPTAQSQGEGGASQSAENASSQEVSSNAVSERVQSSSVASPKQEAAPQQKADACHGDVLLK